MDTKAFPCFSKNGKIPETRREPLFSKNETPARLFSSPIWVRDYAPLQNCDKCLLTEPSCWE